MFVEVKALLSLCLIVNMFTTKINLLCLCLSLALQKLALGFVSRSNYFTSLDAQDELSVAIRILATPRENLSRFESNRSALRK